MKIATAGQENLHTPRTLNNAIYADASSTRGLKLDASIQTAVAAYKMITFSTKASVGFFLKAPDTSGNSYHYGLVYIQNLAGTQAGGLNIWTGNMHLEGNGGGPYGSAYTYTPNAWYWITILYDAGTGGGTFTIAAYETSTWTQVWTATVGSMGTSAPYILEFGRQDWSAGEAGTPFLFYFDNFVLDYTNGTFPMLP